MQPEATLMMRLGNSAIKECYKVFEVGEVLWGFGVRHEGHRFMLSLEGRIFVKMLSQ